MTTKVHAATTSTKAIALLKSAETANTRFALSGANAEEMRKGLEEIPEALRPMFAALLEQNRDATIPQTARTEAYKYYRAVIANVQNHLERWDIQDFRNMDDKHLSAVIQYTTQIYKIFPTFFPTPEGEKSE